MTTPLPLDPEDSRRDFLRKLAAASLAAWAAPVPRAHGVEPVKHPVAKADACIVLWMGGGMAAPDTFDPKRYQPFEKGVSMSKILSTFPAIRTAVDNIQICQARLLLFSDQRII